LKPFDPLPFTPAALMRHGSPPNEEANAPTTEVEDFDRCEVQFGARSSVRQGYWLS
jgi:hypothetical protein